MAQNPEQVMKGYEKFYSKEFEALKKSKTFQEFTLHADTIRDWIAHELPHGVLHGEALHAAEQERRDYLTSCHYAVEAEKSLSGLVLLDAEVEQIDQRSKGVKEKTLAILEGLTPHLEALKQGAAEVAELLQSVHDDSQKAQGYSATFGSKKIAVFEKQLPFLPPRYYTSQVTAKSDRPDRESGAILQALIDQFNSGKSWEAPNCQAPLREKFNLDSLKD